MTARVLVAGIGNVFLGDDGFGVEVASRLREADLPRGTVVGDYGISGMHLAYDLLDAGYETTIFVDAAPRGDPPGTLSVLDVTEAARQAPVEEPADAHGMTPAAVLSLLRRLGGVPGRVLVVGCEPADTGERIGLSPAVEAAVENAVWRVVELAGTAVERGGADVSRHSG
ncbi:hydrogenase maturation protease [Saccharomonospora saliphila]|uniref:hydrogenase maturation protease n=1 Tax=Saccharomonospora saliphila TaxID=369829 RepID=UPI000373DC7C|nr:hydrogenase maturation protease [Saccharomonospora saliphila]